MHNLEHESCWTCDNNIYTLVFWSKAFGWSDDQIDPVLEENIVNQIESLNDHFEEKPITRPVYFCEETHWRPQKMRSLEEFFFDID